MLIGKMRAADARYRFINNANIVLCDRAEQYKLRQKNRLLTVFKLEETGSGKVILYRFECSL